MQIFIVVHENCSLLTPTQARLLLTILFEIIIDSREIPTLVYGIPYPLHPASSYADI